MKNDLITKLKMFRGMHPYAGPTNHLCGDGLFWRSIREEFTTEEIEEALAVLVNEQRLVDRCADWAFRYATRETELQRENQELKDALNEIQSIPNSTTGGDWDEIDLARKIADQALKQNQE